MADHRTDVTPGFKAGPLRQRNCDGNLKLKIRSRSIGNTHRKTVCLRPVEHDGPRSSVLARPSRWAQAGGILTLTLPIHVKPTGRLSMPIGVPRTAHPRGFRPCLQEELIAVFVSAIVRDTRSAYSFPRSSVTMIAIVDLGPFPYPTKRQSDCRLRDSRSQMRQDQLGRSVFVTATLRLLSIKTPFVRGDADAPRTSSGSVSVL